MYRPSAAGKNRLGPDLEGFSLRAYILDGDIETERSASGVYLDRRILRREVRRDTEP